MPDEYPSDSVKETWDKANYGKRYFQVSTEVRVHVVVVDGHDYIVADSRNGGVGILHSVSCAECAKAKRDR